MSLSTPIQGSLSFAYGLGPMTGTITVSWDTAFVAADGSFYPPGEKTIYISHSGGYSFALAPTDTASPAGVFYTAEYELNNGQAFTQEWRVPTVASGVVLSIPNLCLAPAPQPPNYLVQASQIYSPTAQLGDVLAYNGNSFVPIGLRGVFPLTFSAQPNVPITIPGSAHQQGSALIVQVYDNSGNLLDPSINVNPVLGDVQLVFGGATSGYGFIYGGLGRSLPNYSCFFAGLNSISITSSQHGIGSPNMAIAVYDAHGNLINSTASISVNAQNTVNIAFSTITNCLVVICGCLGTGSTPPMSSVSNPSATATVNLGQDFDGCVSAAPGTVFVAGAAVGNPVIVMCPNLPAGVQILGKVTAANQVTLEVWNLSGATVSLGFAVVTITVVQNPLTSTGQLLSAMGTFTPGAISDGSVVTAGTVTVTGAQPGHIALIAASPALPAGIKAVARITGTNSVTVDLWSIAGQTDSIGATTFTVDVLS